jgi:thioredoxin-dependent peroxiredoxin
MSVLGKISRGFAAALLLVFGTRYAHALPAAGQAAPGFSLPSQDGDKVSLKDYRGRWVVLYFYPRDMTSGCTIEAHNFQRDSALYAEANAVVLGVSVDDVASHREFCTKEGLGFKLLADTSGAVSKAYGSLRRFMGKKLSERNTFLIDPAGKIARVYTQVSVTGHSGEVLADLKALQKK